MRNPGLEETQAGIKIAGRNINHLRYADDTTLMAESEEELKSLLMNKLMDKESRIPYNHLISVIPFSSCLQFFPETGSFQMSQFFASGGQSIISGLICVM